MRDTSNQVVLGVFISTFLYCLMIVRAARNDLLEPEDRRTGELCYGLACETLNRPTAIA